MPLTIEPIACSRMPNAMLRPGVRRGEDAAALELRLRRLDEVGGAADHRRREVLERLHHLRAGVARGDAPRRPRTPAARRSSRAAACRCAPGPSPRAAPGTPPTSASKRLLPRRLELGAALDAVHVRVAPRRARRSACRGPSRAPPSSRAPRPRRAARRATSPCRPRAARRSAMCAADDDQRRPRPSPPARPRSRARSASRSFASSTCWTCQPCASKRCALVLAVNEIDVVPSIVMWLSS